MVQDENKNLFAIKKIHINFSDNGSEGTNNPFNNSDKREIASSFSFNEALIYQKLNHKNILKIFHFFLEKVYKENENQIKLNIVMPYLKVKKKKKN
jgi:hypothetical protein